jgi:hypothetical protein
VGKPKKNRKSAARNFGSGFKRGAGKPIGIRVRVQDKAGVKAQLHRDGVGGSVTTWSSAFVVGLVKGSS